MAYSSRSSCVLFHALFELSLLLQLHLADIICEYFPKDESVHLRLHHQGRDGRWRRMRAGVALWIRNLLGMLRLTSVLRLVELTGKWLLSHWTHLWSHRSPLSSVPVIASRTAPTSLTAGEGVFLPDLCDKQRSSPHRAIIQLMSSGEAASGPASSELQNMIHYADAPAPTPY